ncbi:MAG: Uncharacterised protein [Owenweeksia sp. TMED14]|mgnify:CR=1 FL=1|nr:MAG: Uncharacterised protein [Owenweeksia sp. TMED14]
MLNFRANGKLLLTSEYAVLNGAKAIAVPTKRGQTLTYTNGPKQLYWTAYRNDGSIWIEGSVETGDHLKHVKNLLTEAMKIAGKLEFPTGHVTTTLEFPQEWGWGSSSTLTSLIAQWFKINAMELHFKTSNGSGYDVACAQSNQPIFYEKKGNRFNITPVSLENWPTSNIYFKYLGHKINSQKEIDNYNKKTPKDVEVFTLLTKKISKVRTIKNMIRLVNRHEFLMSKHLNQKSPLQNLFQDSKIGKKSLGAWGGDFALLIIESTEQVDYLKGQNIKTFFSWNDVIL